MNFNEITSEIKNLNLKCIVCNNDPYVFIYEDDFLEYSCNNKTCTFCINYRVFLRISNRYIQFFIYPNKDCGFVFRKIPSSFASEKLIPLDEDALYNLLYNYSKDCNIKPIQEKYETLMLFK